MRSTAALFVLGAHALAVDAVAATGFLSQPALHGNRLAFVSERDLWTAALPADPSAPIVASRLTNGIGAESRPVFSPDGSQIAFAAEYDGNVDVYVMPVTGGAPTRLTYHPGEDEPLAWTNDGTRIAFQSRRAHPLGRSELFLVDASGGVAEPANIGECSLIAWAPGTAPFERFAFCRWSNEDWFWKRYRGGTAPDIWVGRAGQGGGDWTFANVTNSESNDLFPMWIGERIVFLSDRSGAQNLWSMTPDGGDLRQITTFVNDSSKPTDPSTYELRWPSADAAGGSLVVAGQAGEIVAIDTADGGVRRLAIDLVSDRAGTLPRFVEVGKNMSAFSLSPSGDRLLIEARGDLVTVPVGKPKKGVQTGARQVTNEPRSREWGATWLSDERIACVTDASGEQQIALLPADGSAAPKLATTDRAQWLLSPVASPDGRFVAFGDKEMRLWMLDVESRALTEIDRSEAGEIVDATFSPDGAWIAWTCPTANDMSSVRIRATGADTRIELSDGLTSDREPRFDPKGEYLWFLSERSINPVITGPDFEFVVPETTQLCAVPLKASTPPPSPRVAAAAGFDLKSWAKPVATEDEEEESAKKDDDASAKAPAGTTATEPSTASNEEKNGKDEAITVRIDADGIRRRIWRAPVEPGTYRDLVATAGGVYFLSDPTRGIADATWPAPPLGEEIATLRRFTALDGETKDVVEGIAQYAASRNGASVAWWKDGTFVVRGGEAEGDGEKVGLSGVLVRIHPTDEWAQMLDETWRLQRDFYWAPNMAGIDWNAMRARYAALLLRAGTRSEAADIMGQLISELGTSHTYIMGFDEPDRPRPINVGLLGADLARDGNAVRVASILPGRPGDPDLVSPLAMPHLGVAAGSVVLSIDGKPVRPDRDPYELLQNRAGRTIVLEIADDPQGNNRRTIEIQGIDNERELRYAQWVDRNRQAVETASKGELGYVHVPDMDSEGLIEFTRTWFPQSSRKGMVIDVRNNGGGWVSQLVLARVARKLWAYQVPRHGLPETYPARVMNGPSVVLIDQHAGSDGDIFPESIRINGLAPLIGTRTWGGVVGIRADKPFLDLGLSSQPEFAWLDPRRDGDLAWSVENVGVSPDIEVDITPADRRAGRDPQLEKAIEVLLQKLEASPPKPTPKAPYPNRSRAR